MAECGTTLLSQFCALSTQKATATKKGEMTQWSEKSMTEQVCMYFASTSLSVLCIFLS